MPRVPPSGFPAVQADTRLGSFRFAGPSPELAAAPGRQLAEYGQAQMRAGSTLTGIATDMNVQDAAEAARVRKEQEKLMLEANRVQVTAAQNRARALANTLRYGDESEPGFLGLTGEAAVSRPDGIPLPQAYVTKLREGLSKIQDALGNDAQKAGFDEWRKSFEVDFQGETMRHTRTEFEKHARSTYEGAVKLDTDEAAKHWMDPTRVRSAIDGVPVPGSQDRYGGVRWNAYQFALAAGKSETEAEYEGKRAASAAHLGVIREALAARNPAYAQAHMDHYKGDMLASDVLTIADDLQRHLDTNMAQRAVQATIKETANRFQPTGMDRLTNIVRELDGETMGRRPDGSPKGMGFLGALPGKDGKVSTELSIRVEINGKEMEAPLLVPTLNKREIDDVLAGRKLDAAIFQKAIDHARTRIAEGKSPFADVNEGAAPLAEMVQKYGNPAQALAAYNAGPDAVDNALKQAGKDGQPDNWVAYLPAETRDYVRRGYDKLLAGGGRPVMPTEMEFTDAAIAKLGPAASPEAIKIVRDEARHQYAAYTRAVKDKGDAVVANAYRELEANGGRFSALPESTRAELMQWAPKDLDNVRNYGARIAKGDDVTDDALYLKLSDKAYLASLSDDAFYRLRPHLSASDFKHFAAQRKQDGGGKAEEIPAGVKRVLDDRITMLGKDPTPKKDDEKAEAGARRRFVDDVILGRQEVLGRQLTDKEVEETIDSLFAKSVPFQNTFMGVTTGKSSERLMGMRADDIPDAARAAIEEDLARRGIADPTDADVLGVYLRRHHTTPPAPKPAPRPVSQARPMPGAAQPAPMGKPLSVPYGTEKGAGTIRPASKPLGSK